MQRIMAFISAMLIIAWGISSFKKRSFHWRGSQRDEMTEKQEPVIFWFSALLCFGLAAMALGAAFGIVPIAHH